MNITKKQSKLTADETKVHFNGRFCRFYVGNKWLVMPLFNKDITHRTVHQIILTDWRLDLQRFQKRGCDKRVSERLR